MKICVCVDTHTYIKIYEAMCIFQMGKQNISLISKDQG